MPPVHGPILPEHRSAASLRVLVVDDDEADRWLTKHCLTGIPGFDLTVRETDTAMGAMAAIAGGEVDVVFLDYCLGAFDGVEIFAQLRLAGFDGPVVLLTGGGDEQLAARFRRIGGADYLAKSELGAEVLRRSLEYVWTEHCREHERRAYEAHLEYLANHDGLTELLNRRAFMQLLYQAHARWLADGEPLALVLVDIDHFKAINDTYGHNVGDEVIVSLAATLRSVAGAHAAVGRYGGEEFAVMLSGRGASDAITIAESVRGKVAQTQFADHPSISCSVGVARCGPGVDDVRGLIARADDALYRAKAAGRNRVIACAA